MGLAFEQDLFWSNWACGKPATLLKLCTLIGLRDSTSLYSATKISITVQPLNNAQYTVAQEVIQKYRVLCSTHKCMTKGFLVLENSVYGDNWP